MQRKILIPAHLMAAGVATVGGLAYARQAGVTQSQTPALLRQGQRREILHRMFVATSGYLYQRRMP